MVISQDVTELKRTQGEVVAAQRMAAVGTLAAGIAHEIDTPIQFVSHSTQFLREATADVFRVVEASQSVRQLVDAGPKTPELEAALHKVDQAEAKPICRIYIGACRAHSTRASMA